MVERTVSRVSEKAHADMGMEVRERFMTSKPSLFRSIRNNPKVVFIAFFAS